MLLAVEEVLSALRAWSLSCPCHTFSFESKFLRSRATERAFRRTRESGLHVGCPMKGCRAPEMAAGRLLAFASLQARLEQTELLSVAVVLSEEDRSAVMGDWSAAETVIHYELNLILSYWSRLPHLVCGLGLAEDDDQCKEICSEAIRLYDSDTHTEKH